MKKITYIGFFSHTISDRVVFPASETKMLSIISFFNKLGYKVDVCSLSMPTIGVFSKGQEKDINDLLSVRTFDCYLNKNKLLRMKDIIVFRYKVLKYLVYHLSKNDLVIVYHSLGLMSLVKILLRIKKVKCIFEVEEIYGDVTNSRVTCDREMRFFCKADSFIFPTKLLNSKINKENKPYAIIHGTYDVESKMDKLFNDGKIHVVYAGTLDPRKGGGIAAASAALYLPSNYHLHILGFGSKEEIDNIKNKVNNVNEQSQAKVTYDGALSGKEYIQFIQSCDIGLSTQNPNEKFNSTSFPSKVLSYLANGLRVVSVRIPAIEQSKVGDLLYYYDTQAPEEIAKVILNIDFDRPYDSRERIRFLANEFEKDLNKLL